MRLEYRIPLVFTRLETDEIVVAPAELSGSQASDLQLADFLDYDLAELGIVGGYSTLIVENGNAELSLSFGSPEPIDAATADKMMEYVRVQMIDGAGEGGFEFDFDGERLIAHPTDEGEIRFEQFDDGHFVPPANPVAIAAKNDDIDAVVSALAQNPEEAVREFMGLPPLYWAIWGKSEAAVAALLDVGADPNRSREFIGPPIISCILNTTIDDATTARLLKLLIRAGAHPSILYSGQTPAEWATSRQKPVSSETLQLVVEARI